VEVTTSLALCTGVGGRNNSLRQCEGKLVWRNWSALRSRTRQLPRIEQVMVRITFFTSSRRRNRMQLQFPASKRYLKMRLVAPARSILLQLKQCRVIESYFCVAFGCLQTRIRELAMNELRRYRKGLPFRWDHPGAAHCAARATNLVVAANVDAQAWEIIGEKNATKHPSSAR